MRAAAARTVEGRRGEEGDEAGELYESESLGEVLESQQLRQAHRGHGDPTA